MWKANVAVLLTLTNLLFGFFALVLVLKDMPYIALAALLLGFLCDGLDGAVARKHGLTSAFGERLDSLSDLMSFGMAPVMFALSTPRGWPAGTLFVAGLFIVCGAVRLARYDPTEQKHMFKGMPIPMAGLLLASFSLTCWPLPWFDLAPGILGLLMISDIPFRKVSFRGFDALLPVCLGICGVMIMILFQDLAFATLAFTLTYLVLNLMAAVARDFRARYIAILARSAAK